MPSMVGAVRDLAVAVDCFVTLAWTRVALRFLPSRLLRDVLSRPAGNRPRGDANAIIAIFNRVAARHPLGHNCLHRSLTLRRVLARHGFAAVLRVGIGQRPNLFPGHAWLEIDGEIVNDDPAMIARYSPLILSEAALERTYR